MTKIEEDIIFGMIRSTGDLCKERLFGMIRWSINKKDIGSVLLEIYIDREMDIVEIVQQMEFDIVEIIQQIKCLEVCSDFESYFEKWLDYREDGYV